MHLCVRKWSQRNFIAAVFTNGKAFAVPLPKKNVNLYQKAKIFSICVHSSEITGSTNIKLGVIDYHSVVGVIGNR